jgi:predicted dehydrogenase
MPKKNRVALIGVGGMARHHLRQMVTVTDSAEIVVLCEPSAEMLEAVWEQLLAVKAGSLENPCPPITVRRAHACVEIVTI